MARSYSLVNVVDGKSRGKDSYHDLSSYVTQIMMGVFGTFVRNKGVIQSYDCQHQICRGCQQHQILSSPRSE
jgi:hypothetical protein